MNIYDILTENTDHVLIKTSYMDVWTFKYLIDSSLWPVGSK